MSGYPQVPAAIGRGAHVSASAIATIASILGGASGSVSSNSRRMCQLVGDPTLASTVMNFAAIDAWVNCSRQAAADMAPLHRRLKDIVSRIPQTSVSWKNDGAIIIQEPWSTELEETFVQTKTLIDNMSKGISDDVKEFSNRMNDRLKAARWLCGVTKQTDVR